MKNCFYATFWTISGQNWQLPVTAGYFRLLPVSVSVIYGYARERVVYAHTG